jgi:hypothetical protein
MSDFDTVDALQTQIDEAQAAGDFAKAATLYRDQQSVGDPHGMEVVPGVVTGAPTTSSESITGLQGFSGETGAATTSGSTRDLTVATNADDETAVVTTEWDFAGNPEHVAAALEAMAWWDLDENGQSTGNSVEHRS